MVWKLSNKKDELLVDLKASAERIQTQTGNTQLRELHPKLEIQPGSDGSLYKFRVYASEREAAQKEEILRWLGSEFPSPRFLGRSDRTLIFEFLETQQGDSLQTDSTFTQIGRILGSMAEYETDPPSNNGLDAIFQQRLHRLAKVGLISPIASRAALRRYDEIKPESANKCFVYWDAMPHNFGWNAKRLFVLDEKHFEFGYEGVGLVKPRVLLSETQWQKVWGGYRDVRETEFVEAHWTFLDLCYYVGALHFYALGLDIGAASYSKNSRLRYFHRALVRDLFQSRAAQFLEGLYIQFRYPIEALRYGRFRVERRLRRKKQPEIIK